MHCSFILADSTTHGDGPRYQELCLTPSELGGRSIQRGPCKKELVFPIGTNHGELGVGSSSFLQGRLWMDLSPSSEGVRQSS